MLLEEPIFEKGIIYAIIYIVFFIIGTWVIIWWCKKKKWNKPSYYALIVNIIWISVIIILNFIFSFLYGLLISYIIDSILGAFIISTLYKQDLLLSLKFTSRLLLGEIILSFIIMILLGGFFVLIES